jgi:hypothetical protein
MPIHIGNDDPKIWIFGILYRQQIPAPTTTKSGNIPPEEMIQPDQNRRSGRERTTEDDIRSNESDRRRPQLIGPIDPEQHLPESDQIILHLPQEIPNPQPIQDPIPTEVLSNLTAWMTHLRRHDVRDSQFLTKTPKRIFCKGGFPHDPTSGDSKLTKHFIVKIPPPCSLFHPATKAQSFPAEGIIGRPRDGRKQVIVGGSHL